MPSPPAHSCVCVRRGGGVPSCRASPRQVVHRGACFHSPLPLGCHSRHLLISKINSMMINVMIYSKNDQIIVSPDPWATECNLAVIYSRQREWHLRQQTGRPLGAGPVCRCHPRQGAEPLPLRWSPGATLLTPTPVCPHRRGWPGWGARKKHLSTWGVFPSKTTGISR